MSNKYVAYYRVSTQQQKRSHLGLEAQQCICNDFVASQNGVIVKEFEDAESGKNRERQGLWDAIDYCKNNDTPLVIAKLDRLARDVEFTFKIINTGVEIHFCDMPQVNTMILGVFASVAQYERELISARTKAALQAKKDRGEIWERNTDTTKAREVMLKNKRQKALSNQSNLFLWNYLQAHERKCGRLTVNTSNEVWDALVEELNALGQTTATGLEYTRPRLRAAWDKIKNLYKYNN